LFTSSLYAPPSDPNCSKTPSVSKSPVHSTLSASFVGLQLFCLHRGSRAGFPRDPQAPRWRHTGVPAPGAPLSGWKRSPQGASAGRSRRKRPGPLQGSARTRVGRTSPPALPPSDLPRPELSEHAGSSKQAPPALVKGEMSLSPRACARVQGLAGTREPLCTLECHCRVL
jgi:hypothetical protein